MIKGSHLFSLALTGSDHDCHQGRRGGGMRPIQWACTGSSMAGVLPPQTTISIYLASLQEASVLESREYLACSS